MGCCDGRSDIRCQRKQSLLIRQLKPTVDEKVGSEKTFALSTSQMSLRNGCVLNRVTSLSLNVIYGFFK